MVRQMRLGARYDYPQTVGTELVLFRSWENSGSGYVLRTSLLSTLLSTRLRISRPKPIAVYR